MNKQILEGFAFKKGEKIINLKVTSLNPSPGFKILNSEEEIYAKIATKFCYMNRGKTPKAKDRNKNKIFFRQKLAIN
ncbi:hypothetical protein BpHYR1_018209 [Brachionus plicatilis]|uniref:Uncharacterized protein n=1 Tax=Brachionus plicatilis TaxID=10195 RepID=A0A3M7S352_BRAPC|nr:hypothetical protein BpHYR1_018209 [Brachionus plicatilis]